MEPESQSPPLLHDIDGALREVPVGRSTFYELMKNGEIPTVKIGRRTFIAHDALRAYVARLSAGVAQ